MLIKADFEIYFKNLSTFLESISLQSKKWTEQERNSAIADKSRDAFRGQSRPPNMVPFHMLGMVSY